MSDQRLAEEAESGTPRPEIVIHVDEPAPTTHAAPPPPHPCVVGRHRWAWLTNGRQACGYCGRPR